MEEPKFTLDDVRDYLENTGALREAELLLTGKATPGFIPTIRKKDTSNGKGKESSPGRTDGIEKVLPSLTGPNGDDSGQNRVSMDELEEFERFLRKKENERALQKNMMELHLKEFEDNYLSELGTNHRKDGGTETEKEVENTGDDTAKHIRGKDDHGDDAGNFEAVEALSEEELANRRIMELAERHAKEMVKNKLYELSVQKEVASLEGGKFNMSEFDTALSLDQMRKKEQDTADQNDDSQEQQDTNNGEIADVDAQVYEDPEIAERRIKLEKLRMEFTTDKQNKYAESLQMSKQQKKPKIIDDRTSASDFLDKWLDGGLDLPKEQGFEEALKGRNGRRSVEKDRADIRAAVEMDEAEEDQKEKDRLTVAGMDHALHAFLSELRSEVKGLKEELAEAKWEPSTGKKKGNEVHDGNSSNSFYPPHQHQQQQYTPYGYPPYGGHPAAFGPNMMNPYFQSPYMGHPPPVGPQPQPPINNEIDRMNKMAEEMERENAKFNVKSADDITGSKNYDGYDPRYTRAHNRLERKHEQDLRSIQIEIEYLKHKKILDDLKTDIENERISREKEMAHNQFLLDQKQQLQAIKLKQALAKEQKILDLQAQSSSDDENDFMESLRTLSGVGPQQIPLELCRGCEVIVDGCSFSSEHLKDIDAFRVALGVFDKDGNSLSRLRASEWQESFPTSGPENVVIYLKNVVRRRADMENDLMKVPKVLVELQVKSKTDMAKSIGWGILNLTSPNDMNKESGGTYDYLSNDLWKVALRPGVSDPTGNPDIPFVFEEGQPASFVLLRVVEINDLNVATSWSPAANGYNTEKDVNNIYRSVGQPRIGGQSFMEVEDMSEEGSVNAKDPDVAVPQIKLDNLNAQAPKVSSRRSSRPTSMRSQRDNSVSQVRGLDPVVEDQEEPSRMMPTGRVTERKRSTDANMWIRGNSSSVEESWRYEPGDGIDVYVDKAMFLPDNCTITRVTVKNLSPEKEMLGESAEKMASISSQAHSPKFDLKAELREKVFNTASSLLIRIDTVDSSNMQTVAVGYSVLKLFCNKERVQCSESNAANTYINSGLFQLPIYPHKVPGDKQLNENIFSGMTRIPCASLLVRIYPAPKSADGMSVLSTEDFDEKEWFNKKVLIPPPEYTSGAYDGSACEPSTTELVSHSAKVNSAGSNITIDTFISSVVGTINSRKPTFPPRPPSNTEADLFPWYKQIMAPSASNFLDYSLCIPYSVEGGISVSIEMLHNMPQGGLWATKGIMFKAIYGLTPPGLYYKDPPLSEGTNFTVNENLQSPIPCPSWTDGFKVLKPSQLEEGLCLIIDIRTLRAEKPRDPKADPKIIVEPPQTRKSYWAILPMAKERSQGNGFVYVRTGNFQVPLFEGSVPTDILATPVPIKEVFSRLQSNNKGVMLKLAPGASVLVRVQNPLLKDFFYENNDSNWKQNINRRLLEQMVAAQSKTGGLKLDAFKYDPQDKKFASYKPTISQLPPIEDVSKFAKIVNKKFSEVASIPYA